MVPEEDSADRHVSYEKFALGRVSQLCKLLLQNPPILECMDLWVIPWNITATQGWGPTTMSEFFSLQSCAQSW